MESHRSLQGSFDARGDFWTLEKPERQIPGRLGYRAGRIELELFGSFGLPLSEDDLPETEVILGYTEVGPCTLWQGIRTRSSSRIVSPAELAHSTWAITHLFLGTQFERANEIAFSSVSFGFDALGSWLSESPFEQSTSEGPDGHPITTVRHEFPESLAVQVPALGASLELDFVFRRGGELFRSISWEQEARLKIVTPDPQPYGWFTERLSDLRSLLGLLVGESVGESVTPTHMSARLPNGEQTNVEIFFSYVGEPRERPYHPAEMLLSRDRLGDRLAPTIETWFEKRETLRPVVALLAGTLYTRELPGEFRFLALTQALETFHRRTHHGLFLAADEYEPVQQSLLASIPTGIPTDLRQALTSRIGYGNEHSQARRLRDLMNSLDEASRLLVSSDPRFVELVVNKRNNLTHYPADASPLDMEELFYASVRLRTLLTFLLLKEINIEGTEAVEGVQRTRWYRVLALA